MHIAEHVSELLGNDDTPPDDMRDKRSLEKLSYRPESEGVELSSSFE